MPALELGLGGLLAIGLALAGCSLRHGRAARRLVLPVVTLLFLSGGTFLAALHQAEMLVYLGLAVGGFLAAMLWEGPKPRRIAQEL
jgi:hypothetical protein